MRGLPVIDVTRARMTSLSNCSFTPFTVPPKCLAEYPQTDVAGAPGAAPRLSKTFLSAIFAAEVLEVASGFTQSLRKCRIACKKLKREFKGVCVTFVTAHRTSR